MTRKGPFAVVWHNERISSVQPNDAPATQGETVIDGTGGTLVPGLYEMHGHISQGGALLNVAAGIPPVRAMGNETELLDGLIQRTFDGTLAGPRTSRSGIIEVQRPQRSPHADMVETPEERTRQSNMVANT